MIAEPRTESAIYCEGYHDRALWAELLLHHGCSDPGIRQGRTGRVPIVDPFGQIVRGGSFAFRTPREHFVRVVPTQGDANLWRVATQRLRGHETEPLARLVISSDLDASSPDAVADALPIHERLARYDIAAQPDGTSRARSSSGVVIHATAWRCVGNSGAGVPAKQTIETLLCHAIAEVHPRRAVNVETWLASRVDPPDVHPKAYSLSYLAGWFPSAGSMEGLIGRLFGDVEVRAALLRRIDAIGVGDVIRSILEV